MKRLAAAEKPVENGREKIKGIREFLAEKVSFLGSYGQEPLEDKSAKELLGIYKEILDAEPSAEKLEGIMRRVGFGPSAAVNREIFRRFLLVKLPGELVEEQLGRTGLEGENDIPLEKLEKLHKAREKAGARMLLGFHASNTDYDERGTIPVSKTESVTVKDGKEVIVPPGYSHYSLNPEGMYKGAFERGGKKYLYLVEGSASDLPGSKEYGKAHEGKGWVAAARELPVIYKMELDRAVEEELGLKRV